MKLIHLSDLHLGKRLKEYSLLEDQAYILKRILQIIDDEAPDGVMIAGDVYDKSSPSAEAVSLFDDFLSQLAKRSLQVFVISGNHDSPERIAFGGRIMDEQGVHMSPVYDGEIRPITLHDDCGPVHLYLLPFIKPQHVRRFHEDRENMSYTEALQCVIDDMQVNAAERNVLITHQFVTGAARSESEEISVGGSDNVDASVFAPFDYVALGHIHSPQSCGSPTIRYCGTPLKYSFSEAKDKKSVTVVELRQKGEVEVRAVELLPKRDMVELKGTFAAVTDKLFYENTTLPEDYTRIILTDETDIPDAFAKLRRIYRCLMSLDYDNTRTRTNAVILGGTAADEKSPFTLFGELFELQNNRPMTGEQSAFLQKMIESIWEDAQ